MTIVEDEYAGMAMNERLSAAGLLEEFDAAVKRRDRDKIVEIYKQLAPTTNADDAADSILNRLP